MNSLRRLWIFTKIRESSTKKFGIFTKCCESSTKVVNQILKVMCILGINKRKVFIQNTLWTLMIILKPYIIRVCFNLRGDISSVNGSTLRRVDKFTYLGSSVSSTKTDINTWLAKAWTAIDRLSVIWKSDLTDKMKRSFFQAAVVSILLYGCTTWTLTKRMEKKHDVNNTECCEQCWTSPGGSTPQSSSYTATNRPSRKLSKLGEPDMRDTAVEIGTSS